MACGQWSRPGCTVPGRPAGHPAAGAGRVGDARRPAEVAADDQQHPLVQAALVQILDQGRDRLVEEGSAVLHGVEDVVIDGVVVPVLHPSAQRAVAA